MKRLKPCPFCGGKAKVQEYKFPRLTTEDMTIYYVYCTSKDCKTLMSPFDTKDDAIKAWNTRVIKH